MRRLSLRMTVGEVGGRLKGISKTIFKDHGYSSTRSRYPLI
ncbi:hypothetical protein [Halothece sp. PCC 7418]|nr:hypothetical protein [Halothece sp. PCC 7418]